MPARKKSLLEQASEVGPDLLYKIEQVTAITLRQGRLPELNHEIAMLDIEIAQLEGSVADYQRRIEESVARQKSIVNDSANAAGSGSVARFTPALRTTKVLLEEEQADLANNRQTASQNPTPAPVAGQASGMDELDLAVEELLAASALFSSPEQEATQNEADLEVIPATNLEATEEPEEAVEPGVGAEEAEEADPEALPEYLAGEVAPPPSPAMEAKAVVAQAAPAVKPETQTRQAQAETTRTRYAPQVPPPPPVTVRKPQAIPAFTSLGIGVAPANATPSQAATPAPVPNPQPPAPLQAKPQPQSQAQPQAAPPQPPQRPANVRGLVTDKLNLPDLSELDKITGRLRKPGSGNGSGSSPLSSLALITALLLGLLLLHPASLARAQAQTPATQSQAAAPTQVDYRLAFDIGVEARGIDQGELSRYQLKLVQDGQALAALEAAPYRDPTSNSVRLHTLFLLSGTNREADLVLKDSAGATVGRESINWRQIPPGQYTVPGTFVIGGVNPSASAGGQDQGQGQAVFKQEKLKQGLPDWAANLPASSTSKQAQASADSTNNSASASDSSTNEIVIRKRNPFFYLGIGLILMMGGAVILLHLSQVGLLPWSNRLPAPAGAGAESGKPQSQDKQAKAKKPKEAKALKAKEATSKAQGPQGAVIEQEQAALLAETGEVPPLSLTSGAADSGGAELDTPAFDSPLAATASAGSVNTHSGNGGGSSGRFKLKRPGSGVAAASFGPGPAPLAAPVAGRLASASADGGGDLDEATEMETEQFAPLPMPLSHLSGPLVPLPVAPPVMLPETGSQQQLQGAKVFVPANIASSRQGAAESMPQLKTRELIQTYGAEWLQAEQVQVNLEFALRSVARMAGLNTYFNHKLRKYMDNGSAIDCFVEASRPDKKGRLTKFIAVEVDGPHHNNPNRQEKDHMKEQVLHNAHIPVVRIKAGDYAALEAGLRGLGAELWAEPGKAKTKAAKAQKGQA
ncbi:MAG TPA: DUF2726 domain-containing protein [Chloroflexia bacterium]|nr:DUF2726 domain-containing protein [Chloroflexia bacterium]